MIMIKNIWKSKFDLCKTTEIHNVTIVVRAAFHYLQVFWKECKYIRKKVISHINDNLSGFSSSGESDEE